MLTYANKQKDLFITVSWLRFNIFERTIPVMNLDEDFNLDVVEEDKMLNHHMPEKEKEYSYDDLKDQYKIIQQVIDITKDVIPHLKRLIQSFQLHHFHWISELGVKAANQTAIIVGTLYTLKSLGCRWMTSLMKSDLNPELKVIPNYHKSILQSELECILSVRIGQIMRNALVLAWQYKKIKRWNLNE